jgi:RimJ/RimL family protein N-acetyltransferase
VPLSVIEPRTSRRYTTPPPCDAAGVAVEVTLRPVQEQDLPFLDRLDLDPAAVGEFEWAGYAAAPRLRKRWNENGLLDGESGILVVSVEGAVAGIASWRFIRRGGPPGVCAEFGVALVPEHRGMGIGTEAQRLLINYLFAHTTVERLEALTDTENLAEQRVLDRLGFQREGVLRHAVWQRGGWRDLVLYAMLRDR